MNNRVILVINKMIVYLIMMILIFMKMNKKYNYKEF